MPRVGPGTCLSVAGMNDRHRPETPDAGKTPSTSAPSQSPQHHVSRRPVLLAAFLGAGSLTGCSLIPGSSSAGGSSSSAKPKAPAPAPPSAAPSPTASATASATATATDGALAGWSLEEKVGQLMMVGVDATAPKDSSTEAVDTHHVGNIFIAGRTTAGGQATQKVIASFTGKVGPGTTRSTPMLVATDQEGGEVQVLSGSGFSEIPSAKAPAWEETVAASCPYSRPHLPMGSLVVGRGMSTRSTTGARFMLTPTSASSLPQVRAAVTSCSRG